MPEKDTSDQVMQLIDMGKEKGFLTYEEVNDILPSDVISPDQIDDLMTFFGKINIDVVKGSQKLITPDHKPDNIPEKVEIKSKGDFILLSSGYPKGEFYRHHSNGALFDNWADLIDQLKLLHNSAKVAVIPYSPIQLPHII